MNIPRIWREMDEGMGPADDIKAAQRMLWRLLGAQSTNSRNGNYGQETANDVGKARQQLGLTGAGPNTEIGATLWEALYPFGDQTAWNLATGKPVSSLKPTPSGKRLPLSKGMKGSDVQAIQRALWRALGSVSTNARNGNWGDETSKDVSRFRQRFSFNTSDSKDSCGQALWDALTRWMDQTAINDANNQPDPPPSPVNPSSLRSAIASAGNRALGKPSEWWYSQQRPMYNGTIDDAISRSGSTPDDCSTFVTKAYQTAGAPNPNRTDGVYDNYGWTGTLESCGRKVGAAKVGDYGLYGKPGNTTHTVLVVSVSPFKIISHGSDPISSYDTFYYRSDFVGCYRAWFFND
jgi:peptidoglycan hydrolase-like protein with peptidoglycan-binding domain